MANLREKDQEILRLAAWEESPVTMLNVAARTAEDLRILAEVVKG